MRDRTWSFIVSWVFIGGCLMTVACGASTPAPPASQEDEVDAGTLPPDGGTGSEPTPSSCAIVAPTTCPDPAPHYPDVAPIFQQRCIICHAGNAGGPWALSDYGHISDWQDTIRSNVLDCTMPPPDAGVPITVEERGAILTWLRCGLPR
jgi:hypothetical protein